MGKNGENSIFFYLLSLFSIFNIRKGEGRGKHYKKCIKRINTSECGKVSADRVDKPHWGKFMVFMLDGSSEHVAHVYSKIGPFEKKSRIP